MTRTANLIGELIKDGKTIHLKEPMNNIRAGNIHILVIQEDEFINETEWIKNIGTVYPELNHPDENIYTVKDGVPFYDKS